MNENQNYKKDGSILIIFLIVILIGIIIGGYYLWQQNAEEDILFTDENIESIQTTISEPSIIPSQNLENNDSNWITYTNDSFGYKISYPKEFKISDRCYDGQAQEYKEYTESPKWLVIIDKNMDANFPYCESDFPQMDIIIKSFDNEININEMMEQSDTDIEDSIKIGDNTWARQIMTEPSILDDSYATYLYLNNNSKGYEIDIKNTNANGVHDEIIDDIIKNFKFI